MSIDFYAFAVRTPKNFSDRWREALASLGMICEFRPDFDPDTWDGGDFTVKMQIVSGAFVGAERYPEKPFVVGCGLDLYRETEFDEERADWKEQCPKKFESKLGKAKRMFLFTTSRGRSDAALRFQLFGAATLAQVTDGIFFDPQENLFLNGSEAIEFSTRFMALTEAGTSRYRIKAFKTWRAALKDTHPEYTEDE